MRSLTEIMPGRCAKRTVFSFAKDGVLFVAGTIARTWPDCTNCDSYFDCC